MLYPDGDAYLQDKDARIVCEWLEEHDGEIFHGYHNPQTSILVSMFGIITILLLPLCTIYMKCDWLNGIPDARWPSPILGIVSIKVARTYM